MLTTRGWWFLVVAAIMLTVGVLASQTTLAVLGLSLLLWFVAEWLLFALRTHFAAANLSVVRVVLDEQGPVGSLWAGRTFRVEVQLRLRGKLSLPHVAVSDRVPAGLEHVDGQIHTDGTLTPARRLTLTYRVHSPAVGQIRFDGLRIQTADLQGFFYHSGFVSDVVTFRVLPVLAGAGGQPATKKRHNLLPPPGIHRMYRPGSGSELLDLRDYLPGDPPKTIAWKVSARRDRLITKEFESEVPVRCTLFVDTSNSVRVGPRGQNALGRLVEIAAAVAQANTGNRDLTGLCLFDEHASRVLRPARTRQHLAAIFNLLVDAAGLTPSAGKVPVETLFPLAYSYAEEVYPHLLRREVNVVPFWHAWQWSGRRLLLSLFVPFFFLFAVAVYTLNVRGRQRAGRRKRLAALLSARHGLAPGGLSALLEDDDRFGEHLQRFLAEHHVPYPLPFYDEQGRYLFASPGKIDVLTRALLQAVGKGHDNELFVLLADLFELSEHIDPLVRAVRVALARHHQVLLICPWPPGLPVPKDPVETAVPLPPTVPRDLKPLLHETTAARFQRAYHHVRHTFARLGIPVLCAQSREPVPLILNRLDRLRALGRKR